MRSRVAVLLCALCVACVVCAVPASAQSDPAETRLVVQLQDDGDARWTVVAVVPLEDEGDVEDFRSFADQFERGDSGLRLGVATFERAAEQASRASGREMTIRSTTREAQVVAERRDGEVVSRYGELRVSFTWTSFARKGENDALYVDDAFNTTSGTWLPGLASSQTLVIKSPPGYGGPSTSPIGANQGNLRWEGPQTFEPGYFEIVYPPPGALLTDLPISTLLLAGAVLLSGAALLLGLYLLYRRRAEDGPPIPLPGRESPMASSNGGATAETDTEAVDELDTESGVPDPELLSDEEQVEYLLEENGGRMKQATIVKETGWSNAKVSQLLSSMAEDERIDKLRIGRENLISLPDEGIGDLEEDSEDT